MGYASYSFTCPLWALLLGALAHPFVSHLPLLSQFLAGAFTLLAALVLFDIGRALRLPLPAGVALLFLVDVYVVGAACNGTEMGLFVLLAAISLRLLLVRQNPALTALATGVSLGLLFLTRPEGLVFLAGGVAFVAWTMGLRRSLVCLGLICLGAVVVVLPWMAFAAMTYGTIVPTSIVLKAVNASGHTPFSSVTTMERLATLMVKGWAPLLLVDGVAVAVLLLRRRARPAPTGEEGDLRFGVFVWALAAAELLGYFAFLKETSISSRYLVVVSPLLAIGTWALAVRAWRRAQGLARLVLRAAVVAAVPLLVVAGAAAVRSRADRARTEDQLRVDIGKWLARHTPPDRSIVTFVGAGAIAYFTTGSAWDFDLISRGTDLDRAVARREGKRRVTINDVRDMDPRYVVVLAADPRFDALGPIVFRNARYRVIGCGE